MLSNDPSPQSSQSPSPLVSHQFETSSVASSISQTPLADGTGQPEKIPVQSTHITPSAVPPTSRPPHYLESPSSIAEGAQSCLPQTTPSSQTSLDSKPQPLNAKAAAAAAAANVQNGVSLLKASPSQNIRPSPVQSISPQPLSQQPFSQQSSASVITLCQQYLSSHGFESAAEALTEIKPFDPQSNHVVSYKIPEHPSEKPPAYCQFRDFCSWIDRCLDTCKAELLEVAFVLFVESWMILLRSNYLIAHEFLKEFWDVFVGLHEMEMKDMLSVVEARHMNLIIQLKCWKATRCFNIFMSRFTFHLLTDFIMSYETTSRPSLLFLIQSRIRFRITSHSITHYSDSDEEGPTSTQITPGALHSTVKGIGTQEPLLWGLLAGPFSCVQTVESEPHRSIPKYLLDQDPSIPIALINGEVTTPINPNLALPLTDESPWSISKIGDYYTSISHKAILSESLFTFPSILRHAFNFLPSEISQVRISPQSGRWVLLGRETGSIELWDVPLLSNKEKDSPLPDDTAMDDTEFGVINEDESHLEKKAKIPIPTPQLLLGHSDAITSFAFVPSSIPSESKNEINALSSSIDGSIRLWNLERRQALALYDAHKSTIWSVDSSPYGNFFLSGGADRLGALWTFGRRQPIRLMSGHTSDVEIIRCWPNSILAATGSADTTVKIWDIRTPTHVRDLRRHKCPVNRVAVSPNGRLVASGGPYGRLYIWDVGTAKPLVSLKTTSAIMSLDFAKGSRFLAAGCADGSLLFVDVENSFESKKTKKNLINDRIIWLGDELPCDIQFDLKNILLVCTIPFSNEIKQSD